MKKVLFLDDSKERIRLFKQVADIPDSDIKYVETSAAAINELKNTVYDIVFLDHDLGGKSFVRSGPGTGYEVAQFIVKLPPNRRPYQVIIHSHNTVGALNIYKVLKNSIKKLQIIPFSDLVNAFMQPKIKI